MIARDALDTSGCTIPTPAQNNLNPPPVPVLSTNGAWYKPSLPKASATTVVKGYTVEEPTTRI